MPQCIHAEVCKHKLEGIEEACSSVDICKFFDDGTIGVTTYKPKRKYTKGGKKTRAAEEEGPGEGSPKIGQKEFKKAYKIIKYRVKTKQLTENQTAAFENIKGKHFSGMSEELKHQIVEMSKEPASKGEGAVE